jgi:putative ABC transport system permease protein
MYGGLLFIGIFFGLIFMLCLLIIMYYKQITEGFEDQKNFEIMQKVGMSDQEVKRTIQKQILQVFFIPIAGAVIHTIVGMFMVIKLMATLFFFQTGLMIACTAGVCVIFALIYWICYNMTARTYFRIVKRMA